MKAEYLKLFAGNTLVRGKERSAIYSLLHSGLKYIPHSMHDILVACENTSLEEVKKNYEPDAVHIIDTYIQFILENKLGFLTTEPERFPKLELTWKSPEIIKVASIAYSFACYDLTQVLTQLDELSCKHLEIRLDNVSAVADIEAIFKHTAYSVIRSINVFICYSPLLHIDTILDYYERYTKIDTIVVYDAPFTNIYADNKIVFTSHNLAEDVFLSLFPTHTHIVNLPYFMEAQAHNTYYNKKVCIDAYGNIKNCLLHANSFGHVNQVLLKDIVETAEFRDLWFASPDKIEHIQDSELRYCLFITNNLRKLPNGKYQIIPHNQPTVCSAVHTQSGA